MPFCQPASGCITYPANACVCFPDMACAFAESFFIRPSPTFSISSEMDGACSTPLACHQQRPARDQSSLALPPVCQKRHTRGCALPKATIAQPPLLPSTLAHGSRPTPLTASPAKRDHHGLFFSPPGGGMCHVCPTGVFVDVDFCSPLSPGDP
ncbi:hypothetical protein LY76DRAFT_353083 [Colletotrichum caudatum]|nr:hypothetical protein LY76DRAFT_353083 [Colletotrichum caudatum]